jgi:hypothetical protein
MTAKDSAVKHTDAPGGVGVLKETMRQVFSAALRVLRRVPWGGARGTGARLRLSLAIGAACLLPALPVRADIGPKPSMGFAFEYEIPRVAIASAEMLECEDAECRTGSPLEAMGPQGFRCTAYDCQAVAYGFSDYHKLIITFDDGGTRESNVFTAGGRGGDFVVTVSEDALHVTASRSLPGLLGCLPGWALTLVVETLVAGLCVGAFALPRSLLGVVPVASLFSLPVVWFIFPLLALPWALVVALSEVFAVVFETGFIYAFTRWAMPLRTAAVLSVLVNSASLGVGLVVSLWL